MKTLFRYFGRKKQKQKNVRRKKRNKKNVRTKKITKCPQDHTVVTAYIGSD